MCYLNLKGKYKSAGGTEYQNVTLSGLSTPL